MGGSTLMELRLGAPVLAGDTPEVMISSAAQSRPCLTASIFPRLLTHADWTRSIPHSPAGPQSGDTHKCENLFVNAARLMCACAPEKPKIILCKRKWPNTQLTGITCFIPGIHRSIPEQLLAWLPSFFVSSIIKLHSVAVKLSWCFYHLT